MADSTDLPRLSANPSTADAPLTAPGLAPAPPSIEERLEHRQLYQPLSVLAVVGLGIALVYALPLAVASIISLWKGSPLIFPFWIAVLTEVFPLLAILVSSVALLTIQTSEGTLGGRRLALAGVGISLAFGLGYGAYYMATYLAIRQKADTVAREWMAHLGRGEDEAAFWWALDPLQRKSRLPTDPANDAAFLKDIETRFNMPEGGSAEGPFSQFERGDLVHVLRQAGSDAKIESLGMSDWGYSPEGYHVTLEYRVTTPEASYELTIALRGNEAQHQEYEGRQWYIVFDKNKTTVRGEPKFTEYGRKMGGLRMQSQLFLGVWQSRLQRGDADAVFLDTCDPNDRERLLTPFLKRLAGVDAMLLLGMSPCNPGPTQFLALRSVNSDVDQVRKETLVGYKEFTQGSLVHADPKHFWVADETRREEILKDVKALFAEPGQNLAASMQLPHSMMPLTREENGRLQVLHQCTLRLMEKKMFVEGVLYVDCDSASASEGTPQAWRVARIELLRAKSLANMPMRGRPGGPGGPGGPGMPGGPGGPGMPGGPPPFPPMP